MTGLKTLLFAPLLWMIAVSTCQAQTGRPEVLLLRGGAGYWPGVRAIANDLADHGFDSKITLGSLYALQAAEIAADYRAGRRGGPVTIVGYSSGADFACKLCGNLEARGIPVATLVLMESTLGTPVPANVEMCVNLYESRPATDWIPAFRGIPVEALGSNTELMNLDVKSTDQLQWLTSYNHFTIASNAEMRVLLRNLLVLRQSQFVEQHSQPVSQAPAPKLQPVVLGQPEFDLRPQPSVVPVARSQREVLPVPPAPSRP